MTRLSKFLQSFSKNVFPAPLKIFLGSPGWINGVKRIMDWLAEEDACATMHVNKNCKIYNAESGKDPCKLQPHQWLQCVEGARCLPLLFRETGSSWRGQMGQGEPGKS